MTERHDTRTVPAWRSLAAEIAGDVVLPESPGYDVLRKPEIARFHHVRPRAVVRCACPEDVVATLAFVRRHHLPTAIRGGGHCFAGRSSTDGVVLDVAPMRAVSMSADSATVGAGARLGDMYDALARAGRTVPAGCGPTVGIAGLVLGGGIGILGRRHGLAADQLLAATIVLADGQVIDCDDRRATDLFWALRGAGGGQFGVVTSLVLRTVPAPVMTSFHLVWPYTRAAAVLRAWQDWAPVGPDELSAGLLVTVPADLDEAPETHVFGTILGGCADASELLAGLVGRVGTDPVSASSVELSYRDTKRHLAEHGPGDRRPLLRTYAKSEFFARPLPDDVVGALVTGLVSDRVTGQSRALEFLPWGGAYNGVRPDATAFPHRDARFLLKHGVAVGPDTPDAGRRAARNWLNRSWALARPWGTGGAYPGFPDPDLRDWQRAYHGRNYERLLRVKTRYDPTGFFRFHQSLSRPEGTQT